MLSEVATHIQHRIANAPIQTDPFPHFYVENVFPDRFYQDLLSHLPALGVYQPLKEQGLVTDTEELYKDRYIIHFREEALEQFDAADRGIWRDFTNWLSGETVVSLALDKFASLVTEYCIQCRLVSLLQFAAGTASKGFEEVNSATRVGDHMGDRGNGDRFV